MMVCWLPLRLIAGVLSVAVFVMAMSLQGTTAKAARPSGAAIDMDSGLNVLLDQDTIRKVQDALSRAGLYRGAIDGQLTLRLEDAIRAFQRHMGLIDDGRITPELLERLADRAKVQNMLRRLAKERAEGIARARAALLENPSTRQLLIKRETGPTVLPDGDLAACLAALTTDCLLTESFHNALREAEPTRRDWALGEILSAQALAGLHEQTMTTVERISDLRLIVAALGRIAVAEGRAGRYDSAREAAQIIPFAEVKADTLLSIAEIQSSRQQTDTLDETIAQAQRAIDAVAPYSQRLSLLMRVAVVLVETDFTEQAEAVLSQALTLVNYLESETIRDTAQHEVVITLAKMSRPEQAQKALAELSGKSDFSVMRMAIADAQMQQNRFDEARATAEQVTEPRYRVQVLARLAEHQAEAGLVDDSLDSLETARALVEAIKLPFAHDYALRRIVAAAVKIGRPALAEDVAEQIGDPLNRAHALWDIIVALRAEGDSVMANRLEQLALAAGQQIIDRLSLVWMLADLVTQSNEQGDQELAQRAFAQALDITTVIKDPWSRARAFARMAEALLALQSSR